MAMAFTENIQCDKQLVSSGALLHDIGRAVDHSIYHACMGAKITEDLGLSEDITEIVRRHTGAGLDEFDVEEFGLPPADYIPRTIEQKIVAHADNMVSDNRLVVHSYSVDRLRTKGSDRGADRIANLHKELSKLYGSDLDLLVEKMGTYPEMTGIFEEFTVPRECRF